MTVELAAFPDVEEVVLALIELTPALGNAVQTTPAEMADTVVIRVLRVGGGDDGITDRALVDVTVFAPKYAQAREVAEQVRQRMLAAGGKKVPTTSRPSGVLIDRCVTATGPQEIPYDNPELRRKPATYRVELRRPRS